MRVRGERETAQAAAVAARVASSTVDDVRKAKPKWRTQRHAHSCYKSCGSPAQFSTPLCCPSLVLFFSLLQHLSALLVRPFSCSYVNYCLSARCPLSFASSFSSFSFSTVTFHYTSVFFSAHTHTCTLYTLVPFRILLHILPLLFLPSFACLSLLLKEAKRAGTEQSLRRIKVATLLLCFSSAPLPLSLPPPTPHKRKFDSVAYFSGLSFSCCGAPRYYNAPAK